ncbi:MAG: hypothetical protein JSV80_16275 [Acidobacteriota bacterium]|nr:MAG: hypothetical protein JSV80_16275 [Acidobacteriota bacterium]
MLAAWIAAVGIVSGLASAQPAAEDFEAREGCGEATLIVPLASSSLLLDAARVGSLIVAVGERGHVLRSEDLGATWGQIEVPTRAMLTGVTFADEKHGWAVGHDEVILRTEDGGLSWELSYCDPDDQRPLFDVWFEDDRRGLAIGAYGLMLETDDGGLSWSVEEFEIADDDSASGEASFDHSAAAALEFGEYDADFGPIDYHLNQLTSTDGKRLYVAAEAGTIYRSDDAGRSWMMLPSPYEGSFFGSLPLGEDVVLLFGLRGHVFRSEDAGETWSRIDTGTEAMLVDGVQLADGRLLIAGIAGTLLVSQDEGRSFQLHSQADRLGVSRVVEHDDGSLLLFGEGGIRRLPSAALQDSSRSEGSSSR